MCGIAGTFFQKKSSFNETVTSVDLTDALSAFTGSPTDCDRILDLAWELKAIGNFIRYCKSDDEKRALLKNIELLQRLIDQTNASLKGKNKNSNVDTYLEQRQGLEKLKDAQWFLDIELPNWIDRIEELAKSSIEKLSDNSIAFYRNLNFTISAIDNRLELRGRDSFGLSIILSSQYFDGSELNATDFAPGIPKVRFSNISGIGSYTLLFKVHDVVGQLGDNARKIIEQVKSNSSLNALIREDSVEFATFVAHTRWASVGGINLENTLPLCVEAVEDGSSTFSVSALNGDILNYNDILSNVDQTVASFVGASGCTSDARALPALYFSTPKKQRNDSQHFLQRLDGSYVITYQNAANPSVINLIKHGVQGLYLGVSGNETFFASDIYGLVENCRYFFALESGDSLSITADNISEDPFSSIMLHRHGEILSLAWENLEQTPITTRDISKRGFEHFLEKEICQTSEIVEKTLSYYLANNDPTDYGKHVGFDETEVPSSICHALESRKIQKIVITGMGTCYTAAVAISMYMRSKLKRIYPELIVEPHIASEGSGFYLEPIMRDTLVIVIAQSGTTVDTNVYVQMAKDRGAFTLALANKRQGDVTFLVDGTMYIGDGRDLEIAVPSTKTYTAHVVLGYLLSNFFFEVLDEHGEHTHEIQQSIASLRGMPQLIDQCLSVGMEDSLFSDLRGFAQRNLNWYVVRDESANGVCADEIRIKFSENCYQSVASLSLGEVLSLNVSDSFVTIISLANSDAFKASIRKLLERGNSIALITVDGFVSEKDFYSLEGNNLRVIKMPTSSVELSFIPTILAGQILSYRLAQYLDERKNIFLDTVDALQSGIQAPDKWNEFHEMLYAGAFDQGFRAWDILRTAKVMSNHFRLQKTSSENSSTATINALIEMANASRRTIDTIKHQAKTITVGAIRSVTETGHTPRLDAQLHDYQDCATLWKNTLEVFNSEVNKLSNLNFDDFTEVVVVVDKVEEALGYNLVSFLNETLKLEKRPVKFRLAQYYDFNRGDPASSTSLNLFLQTNSFPLDDVFADQESVPNNIVIRSIDLTKDSYFSDVFGLNVQGHDEVAKAVWCQLLCCVVTYVFVHGASKGPSLEAAKDYWHKTTKELLVLANALKALQSNQHVKLAMRQGALTLLSRQNWKCLGSGGNYNSAKFAAKHLIKNMKRCCAVDVLENHKHIDMSAESASFVFIGNIWKAGYSSDAFSEIKKMAAHHTLPIIVTNTVDNRFDGMRYNDFDEDGNLISNAIPIIKISEVLDTYSHPLNVSVVCCLTDILREEVSSANETPPNFAALFKNRNLIGYENFWK